jgi:26S proteasome regulatory subunit N8
LIPNHNVDELVKAMLIKTNDMYLVIYVASLVRSVIALHGLLQNKIKYSDIDDILDKRAGVETTAEAKDNDNGTKETKATSPKASSPRSASKK